MTTSAFNLPEHLEAKADPALVAGDEQHFAAIARSLEDSITGLTERVDAARREAGGTGLSKGLGVDLVVVIDPASFGDGIEGAVDRYVAMTRATQRLVVLTGT